MARGGRTTAKNLRLRCRAHNQHAAECAFGKGFMREKREAARHSGREAQTRHVAAAETRPSRERPNADALAAAAQELVPWLREVGCRPDDARQATARGGGDSAGEFPI